MTTRQEITGVVFGLINDQSKAPNADTSKPHGLDESALVKVVMDLMDLYDKNNNNLWNILKTQTIDDIVDVVESCM